ncbi:TetR/AcrR family transcriptional regulator C-terminal domain-containing protein [Streptomyces sp. ISL-11]|uniref:TetR/AcrR family transcriptional regulator C-terminal domain-containing protein n=1 Tax=Streptomyces sp. ISL-11 TaxID=2819174 RepID=UPI001BED28CD|nr:TetR/AcrR family transcriptional regulator C-terminal domain-containing protein [Streptomyces sp. ISL-11]MBT2386569.1 TetR/AcrR family transcriptional regulator C-terminal domain-containing protein [Streptomyces sp. ISL-11]
MSAPRTPRAPHPAHTTQAQAQAQGHPASATPAAAPSPASLTERRSVARAARALLARTGWRAVTRQAIATEAHLPLATVRALVPDTGQLLLSLVLDSFATVAAALAEIAEHHPEHAEGDLGGQLRDLAHAWLSPLARFPEHFTIVRRLSADLDHLPPGTAAKWQMAGPRQTRTELARALARTARAWHLDIDDADRAADHFLRLACDPVTTASFHGALPLPAAAAERAVAAGVEDFLRLYRPTTATP